jgi:hypothetical protein
MAAMAKVINAQQALISTGIADAITAARQVAGDLDVSVMGGGAVSAALVPAPGVTHLHYAVER